MKALTILIGLLLGVFACIDYLQEQELKEQADAIAVNPLQAQDSAWIYRIVGSRHRLMTTCKTGMQFRWYESIDNDSFYLRTVSKDLIFGLDRYYTGIVICNGDTLTTDTIQPCDGLTAYFDYFPDNDCTAPYVNSIRPRNPLMNNCTVDSMLWYRNGVLTPWKETNMIPVKHGDVHTLVYFCNAWGCSDTTSFTYYNTNGIRLVKSSTQVILKAPSGLQRADVQWYAKHPTIGGWAESMGGSYSTYTVNSTSGYRYYARVKYAGKIYFTNVICI